MKPFLTKLRKIFLTPLGTRMSKEERAQSRGVALLMVMISMILVTSIIIDLAHDEQVRYQLAVNTRDSIKAQALAEGALNWGLVLLTIQDLLQDKIAQLAAVPGSGATMPAFTVWQLLPLDSDKLKTLVNGQVETIFFGRREGREGEKQRSSDSTEGGFGGFDGTFHIEVVDEESKISLQGFEAPTETRGTIRRLLASLTFPERYDDIFTSGGFDQKVDRLSVIANLLDWVKPEDLRSDSYEDLATKIPGRFGSGSRRDPYSDDKGVVPKGAFFDSMGELRLVHGVTDEFEQAFFDAITIYGQGGKINILSAKDQVVEALMRFCALNNKDPHFANLNFADEMLKKWKDWPNSGSMSVTGFLEFLKSNELQVDDAECKKVIDGVKSLTFTITAKATVPSCSKQPCNSVTRTLTLVARMYKGLLNKYYFRSR
jgi:hypothetical protein